MPEPQQIFDAVIEVEKQQKQTYQAWLDLKQRWNGKSLLISAGPTYENIDPVRYIGNRSSGKMGFAIAEVAAKAGANVTLVSGPVNLNASADIERIDVRSAQQMFSEVKAHYSGVDCFISAAAVADFKVTEVAQHKIKKQSDSDEMTLKLVKNPDIVAWVAQQADKPFVVGFAAETQNVIEYAKDKLKRKGLDMICANQVGDNQGFEQDNNSLTLITEGEVFSQPVSSKTQQALDLLLTLGQKL